MSSHPKKWKSWEGEWWWSEDGGSEWVRWSAKADRWTSGGTRGGEDGGSERARGSEEINKSDGRTSGAIGAAGVSTVDPDGGAGILE